MSRINAVDPAEAPEKSRPFLDAVNKSLGMTPNLFRVAAQAPAALEGMVSLTGALSRGRINARTREAIALAVAQTNGCDYCLSAHSLLGKGAGLTEDAIAAARHAGSADPRIAAILTLARAIVEQRGRISDAELAAARTAGLTDGEIVEVVGHVVANIFTNYLNNLADTDIDFPAVHAAAA